MSEPRYDVPDGVGRYLLEERFGQDYTPPALNEGIGSLSNSGSQYVAPGYDPATATFGPQNSAGIGFPSSADFAISQAISLDERAMEDLQNYYERTGTGPNLSSNPAQTDFARVYAMPVVTPADVEVSPGNYTPVNPPPQAPIAPLYAPNNLVDQVVYEEQAAAPLYNPMLTSGIFSGG